MTDLPRRSYPLVVPPPAGFEDAVRRGRRIRRRRAGSSTGAALALVGALAMAFSGSNGGTSGLQPTDDVPYTQQTEQPSPGTSASPEPTASPSGEVSASPTSGGTGGSEGGYLPGDVPPTQGPGLPTDRPRDPDPGRPFAARDDISETTTTATAATACDPTEIDSDWCAYANVDPVESDTRIDYWLVYTVCRHVSAGDEDIEHPIRRKADFSVTYLAENDTLWTYSRGVSDSATGTTTRVTAGGCVEWRTLWNGYDDYGDTPRGVTGFRLRAWTTGTSESGVLPTAQHDFDL